VFYLEQRQRYETESILPIPALCPNGRYQVEIRAGWEEGRFIDYRKEHCIVDLSADLKIGRLISHELIRHNPKTEGSSDHNREKYPSNRDASYMGGQGCKTLQMARAGTNRHSG
jgi:hypothetical protein